jgi:hypothetical protein
LVCSLVQLNNDFFVLFSCRRVTGELITPATWFRRFVTSHPDYKQDSIITSTIAYDLMMTCQGIGDGTIPCPELLGDIQIAKVRKEDAFGHVLAGKLSSTQRIQLLQSLIDRAQIPRSRSVPRGKARTYSESNTPDNTSARFPRTGTSTEQSSSKI